MSLALAVTADAETYPTKSVHVIVPFAAGGPTDVIARLVAQRLSEVWGHQVYTENIPGAGGNTAVGMAARAAPDGYTILVVSTGFIVNPSMYTKIPYDPIKDFAPISLVAASPNIVFVNPQVPAKIAEGAHRPRQGQPRQIQLCPARDRLDAASRRRNVQAAIQPRSRHRAVSTARRSRSIPPSAATRRSHSPRCRRP